MVDYQTISIVLTGIGMMIALTYYALQIRNQNRTRQAQLHMQIFNELNSEGRWRDFLDAMYSWEWDGYDDFQEKYGTSNPDVYAKLTSLWWVYNSIGTLLYDGLLDAEKLYPLIGPMVIMQWTRWESVIMANRKRLEQPESFIHFEYLAKEMLRVKRLGYRDVYVSKIIQMEP